MKILFISPNYSKSAGIIPSLGLACLKSYMDANTSFKTEILDLNKLKHSDVKRKLYSFKPDIVGISCLTIYRHDAINVSRLVKNAFPKCKVVLGGPHPTFMYRQLLENYPYVDIVVIGEGEITFKELASAIDLNQSTENIKGIAFRKNGEIHVSGKREIIHNLDELPFPVPMRNAVFPNDNITVNNVGMIMSSRGCNYGCNFCSSTRMWKKWRGRSPESVFKEMQMLVNEQKKEAIAFVDDEFTLDMSRITKLCQILIDNNWTTPWSCNTRVDHVSEGLFTMMKKAGCVHIGFGVESGSEKILKNINKKITVSQIKRAFASARTAGLKTKAFIMIGNVGETAETVEQTKKLILELNPDQLAVSRAVIIFPGSSLYDKSIKAGWLDDSVWLEKKTHVIYDHENSIPKMASWQINFLNAFYKKRGILSYMKFVLSNLKIISLKDIVYYLTVLTWYKKHLLSSRQKNGTIKPINNITNGE
jgi:anaerobic magnesium-protoporphyrin IX monomethyl ester cyclase